MRTVSVVLACLFALGTGVFAQQKAQGAAQEKPPAALAAPSEQPKPLVPLKVQIVLSRFKDDKKIGNLPYVLGVTANERNGKTSLRMGVDVPIANKNQGYSYRSVGTNIDCEAQSSAGDSYKLNILVQDSSIHLEASKPTPGMVADVPAFRTFNSSFTVLLRDGQTSQHTSAVDPISGEVMKIDVTLNVLK